MMIHEPEKKNRRGDVLDHPEFVTPVADRCERTEDEPEQGNIGADAGPVVEVAHKASSVSGGSEMMPVHERLDDEWQSVNGREEY